MTRTIERGGWRLLGRYQKTPSSVHFAYADYNMRDSGTEWA
jgi:hypothetical protein